MIKHDDKIGDLIFHPALYSRDIERIKEMVEKFLTEGGDINREDDRGRTIFGVAKFSNHKDVDAILDFLKTKNSDERIGKYYESLQEIQNTVSSARENTRLTPTIRPTPQRNSATSLSSRNSSQDPSSCAIL